ncbi:MAG: DUF4157 domain-containing protein [Zoogloea sp.]|nr:DUF4157 domain-containing protein [Zoogloea sp.]
MSIHLTLRRGLTRATRHAGPAISPSRADACRESVADALGAPVQTKLNLGKSDDIQEREADTTADRVIGNAPVPAANTGAAVDVQRKCSHCEQEEPIQRSATGHAAEADQSLAGDTAARIQSRRGAGSPLPASEQSFFESRLGQPLDGVRVHDDPESARLSRQLSAQAFTVGQDVFFGAGQYRPGTPGGRHLIAHELTHVRQQANHRGQSGTTDAVQRKLELRPPGKGEASAFDRAQEFVDKLNTVSPAIQYALTGQALTCTVVDAATLTHFDKTMQGFIERGELVPMRLITAKGRVGGQALFGDSFRAAYVDLDDMLKDDIYSFQSDLLHFLTERFVVRNYDKKIGGNMDGLFKKAHRAGKDAEAAQLQALFNDPSIAFVYEDTQPNHTWVNAFKSKANGFWIFQVVKKSNLEVAGGEMWVRRKDGKRVSIDDFRKERGTAAP